MIVASHSLYIAAPVERVFVLMADPAERARLNPDVTPIRVEVEGGGTLGVGGVVHFRLQIDNRLADYRVRVLEFVPPRRIVTLSDTAIPFEVCIETIPESGGTRLTQTERFEPSEAMLLDAAEDAIAPRFSRVLGPLLLLMDPDYAQRLRADQERRLTRQLEERLARWLAAIRAHLESAESPPAPP